MLFDSDIVIWGLRGNAKALKIMESDAERAVSAATHLELLHGVQDKRQMTELKRFLREFETIPLSDEIGILACLYMESHGLRVRFGPIDALIAATATSRDIPLCTGNTKHFRAIDDLEIVPFRA